MMSKKIYEDVLDSLDEIQPDVPEEKEEKYPILRDGYACTILVSGQCSMNRDVGGNVIPDVLKVYLDEYADDYRMAVLSSEEDLTEFAEETGAGDIEEDDDQPHTVVQFNASRRNRIRIIFWILSVGTYFMRFIRSGKKWKIHIQMDVFDVYELVRGSHREIKDGDLNYIVTVMTEFVKDEGFPFPDFKAYDYARKIVGTYSEMFGKRQPGQTRAWTSQ